jgi:tetratricopeptide (TPR) repeat protein
MMANPWEDVAIVLGHAEQARAANNLIRACAFFTRATELEPGNANAWMGRAATTSDQDDAILCWGHALALEPEDSNAQETLAARVDEKLDSRGPTPTALIGLGKALAELGQKPQAYRLIERATAVDPANEEAWIWRAGLTEDGQETISALSHALALNPENAQARAGLEWAMSRQPDSTTSWSPTRADETAKLVDQGQAALAKGDRVPAHELFQRATELDPKNEQAWLWRGSTTSDIDEALTCMEQALAINPENGPAREARSWLLVRKLRSNASSQAESVALAPGTPAVDSESSPDPNRRLALLLLVIVLLILALLVVLHSQAII